jgi:hypothetical protein
VYFFPSDPLHFWNRIQARSPEVASLCKPTTVSASIIFESITLFTLLLVQYRTKICHFLGKIFSGTFLIIKTLDLLILRPPKRTHKLQEKPSKDNIQLLKIKFHYFFLLTWVTFGLLDPDPIHWADWIRIWIGNTGRTNTCSTNVMVELTLLHH